MAETHFPTMEGCLHNPWGRHHYRQSLASSDGRCRFGNTALMIGALAQENSAAPAATDAKQRPSFQTARPASSTAPPASSTARPASVRDGQLWRLKQPLSGSNEWLEYDGSTVVRKILDGRANLVELKVVGPTHTEALNLRLYNPETHKWSLNLGR